MFRRLIDDVFTVFTTELDAKRFATEYNNLHPNIKVTNSISKSEEFLDLTIQVPNSNIKYCRLKVSLHQKVHHKFAYMSWYSFHPQSSKLGFIKAELIRAVRNNSQAQTFHEYVPLFAKRLQARGYPFHIIKKAFAEVSYSQRRQYLFGKSRKSKQDSRIIFSVQYNPLSRAMNLRKILKEEWKTVAESMAYDIDWIKPPMVAYKRSATLARILNRDRESADHLTADGQSNPNPRSLPTA
jgi:hypothetical protein